jgi:hypothetical protein
MNDNERPRQNWDWALDRLVADATIAAYAVALQHAAICSWVDLQLGLWDAMAQTVREWDRRRRDHEPRGTFSQ